EMTDARLPDQTVVSGSHPLVLIGPNGVGKTQFGVRLARENNDDRISALRNIELETIPMQPLHQAIRDLDNAYRELLDRHWRSSYELQNLMAAILEEHREEATKYVERIGALRKESPQAPAPDFAETRFQKLARIWGRNFPDRTIAIAHEPKVK